MSKELELFQQIVKGYTEMFNMAIHHPKDTIVKWEGVDEIENALKEYELMKNIHFIVANKKISDDDLEKLKNQRVFANGLEESKVELLFDEETRKKLKALEIIKNKEWFDDFMKEHLTREWFTKDELDLLKEVFDE